MAATETSVERVFGIPELLENILIHLPMRDLFAVKISKTFKHAVDTSPSIQRALFLLPDPKAEGELNKQGSLSPRCNPLLQRVCDDPTKLEELLKISAGTLAYRMYLSQPPAEMQACFRLHDPETDGDRVGSMVCPPCGQTLGDLAQTYRAHVRDRKEEDGRELWGRDRGNASLYCTFCTRKDAQAGCPVQ